MTGEELYQELHRRGHLHVYHACTITSFLEYCKAGGYHSRKHMWDNDHDITPQPSDEVDERIGIDNHLFINVYDQHADVHKGRSVTGLNKYGPLCMAFNIDFLRQIEPPVCGYGIEITDPNYDENEHAICELQDFRNQTFSDATAVSVNDRPARIKGTPGPNMCVHFEADNFHVDFEQHLSHIILDALPEAYNDLFLRARTDLRNAIIEAGLENVLGRTRNCIQGCGCQLCYGPRLSLEQTERFFYRDNIEVFRMTLPKH